MSEHTAMAQLLGAAAALSIDDAGLAAAITAQHPSMDTTGVDRRGNPQREGRSGATTAVWQDWLDCDNVPALQELFRGGARIVIPVIPTTDYGREVIGGPRGPPGVAFISAQPYESGSDELDCRLRRVNTALEMVQLFIEQQRMDPREGVAWRAAVAELRIVMADAFQQPLSHAIATREYTQNLGDVSDDVIEKVATGGAIDAAMLKRGFAFRPLEAAKVSALNGKLDGDVPRKPYPNTFRNDGSTTEFYDPDADSAEAIEARRRRKRTMILYTLTNIASGYFGMADALVGQLEPTVEFLERNVFAARVTAGQKMVATDGAAAKGTAPAEFMRSVDELIILAPPTNAREFCAELDAAIMRQVWMQGPAWQTMVGHDSSMAVVANKGSNLFDNAFNCCGVDFTLGLINFILQAQETRSSGASKLPNVQVVSFPTEFTKGHPTHDATRRQVYGKIAELAQADFSQLSSAAAAAIAFNHQKGKRLPDLAAKGDPVFDPALVWTWHCVNSGAPMPTVTVACNLVVHTTAEGRVIFNIQPGTSSEGRLVYTAPEGKVVASIPMSMIAAWDILPVFHQGYTEWLAGAFGVKL